MIDLRKQFFDILLEMAKQDEKIILLTGDLGYSFCEKFQNELPKQFLNCGCIEQTMTGIGAGMALAGLKPYLYSNAIFILMRNYEQVRDDIAYNNLNVKLIGTGASGFLGFTHNLGASEDEGKLIEGLPNIFCAHPENETQLKDFLLTEGPGYIRI